jgi:hypothetical protein
MCRFQCRGSASLVQIGLDKTFRHLLNSCVLVSADPGRCREIEFQFSLTRGTVRLFVNVNDAKYSGRRVVPGVCVPVSRILDRCGNRKSQSIPAPFRRHPTATAGIAQIAETFEDILRRNGLLVAGSRAMATPSATERKTRRVRPVPAHQLRDRHEIGTSQRGSFLS